MNPTCVSSNLCEFIHFDNHPRIFLSLFVQVCLLRKKLIHPKFWMIWPRMRISIRSPPWFTTIERRMEWRATQHIR